MDNTPANVTKLVQQIDNLLIDQNEIDNYQGQEDDASIKSPSHWFEDVIKRYDPNTENSGAVLPWEKCKGKVAIRKGEVSLWAGYNGHKKSMGTGQVMLDLVRQGHKICIASLEMHPSITLMRMASQAICNTRPTESYLRKMFSWLEGKMYLFDQQNTVPTERILKMAHYCGEVLKLDDLVIDSLMKCGMSTDDYNAQKNFINELCAIAKSTGMHIHLITHLRKPSTNPNHVPNRYDIAGHADISNQADNIFILWANMTKNEEKSKPESMQDEKIMGKPCQKILIEKQRNGEFEGVFNLWFDQRSLQMKENEHVKPFEYWRCF